MPKNRIPETIRAASSLILTLGLASVALYVLLSDYPEEDRRWAGVIIGFLLGYNLSGDAGIISAAKGLFKFPSGD